jgi:hypothetical protein
MVPGTQSASVSIRRPPLRVSIRPRSPSNRFRYSLYHASTARRRRQMPRVRTTKKVDSSELRRYALVGAQARLEAITSELAAIRQAFPELANGNVGAHRTTTGGNAASRRRRTMSAAQRKAVGERMKKYWAAKRAAADGAAPKAGSKRGRTAKRTKAAGKRGARKMSAAARKRISDAQKARWAKRKGAAT